MAGLRRLLAKLVDLLRPGRAEADLSRELASHLALLEDELLRRGLPAEQARRAARLSLGGVEQVKELHRDERSFVWLDDARRDLRHAVRLLRRDPLFALTAVLSLAIGIGANTTIFSVANALLFRAPAGVADPARLVDIGVGRQGVGFNPGSYPNYLDVRQRATTLDGVYASEMFGAPLGMGSAGNDGRGEVVSSRLVTANYFTVLGAHPAAGRLFAAGDGEQPGAVPVVVLSHRLWKRRFNEDPAIAGRTLRLNGHPFTVAGVAAEGFQGTHVLETDVWLPLGMIAAARPSEASLLANRGSGWLVMGGRLKPDVSVAQAAAELAAIGRALEREFPDQNRGKELRLRESSSIPGASGPVTALLALLMGVVSLVLVIACANVAGVLLARAAARRREIAVRLAIGAGQARLVRQLLTETAVLCGVGGLAGLLLARGLTSLLVSLLPRLPFPIDVSMGLDGRVILFTTGLSLIAALLCGLVPARQASQADVVSTLKDDSPGASGRSRLRNAFVVAQVAFSLVLVVATGLFVRALRRAGSTDPGFDPRGVELVSVDPSAAGYGDVTGPLFARELIERVRELPDTESATIARVFPGGFEGIGLGGVTVPGDARASGEAPEWDWNIVEPGYFSTLRIPLVAGRDFGPSDRAGSPPVAIVGEAAARHFWPGENAIGRSLVQFGAGGPASKTATLLVVGVARDVKSSRLVDGLSSSFVYVPLQQRYTSNVMSSMTIAVRTSNGPRMAAEIRRLVASMNPNLPIVTVQTLEDYTALGLVPQHVVASVSGSLGLVGLLLAAIGIYGVTAHGVTRRMREFGIRVALGAKGADILVMVLRQGMSLAGIGCAIGLALAAAVSQVLTGFLFGLPPLDPLAFGGASALFLVIALAACYGPARRAARADPLVALRYE